MSAKRTAMRKLREVLRLSYSTGLSIRKISASTKISVGSIQNILKLAVQLGLTWPLPEDWDDQALALKFYPRSDAQPSAKFQEPVWTTVHMELKKKGLTKQLLWDDCMDRFSLPAKSAFPTSLWVMQGGRATQEQLPRNTPSRFRTVAIATRSSAPVMQAGGRNKNAPCGRLIVPVTNCLSIMQGQRCRWSASQPVKFAPRRSLWRCWAPPITLAPVLSLSKGRSDLEPKPAGLARQPCAGL